MATYTDGFVLTIKKEHLAAYTKIAKKACKIWMELGALDYRECAGDDLDIKDMLPFPKLAKAKPDELVIFSYIEYKSRKHRDEVNKKVMADPRIHAMCDESKNVVNCKKMAYGGFKAIVEP